MSGNGVGMMSKFIETNGLQNTASPAIFLAVHGLLDKKLKRIKAIEELYESDGDKAPMTVCPECGSPTLVVHNCEFCGYAMIDMDASSEGTVDDAVTAVEANNIVPDAVETTTRGRGRATETKVKEVKEVKQTTGRTSRAKAPVVPTKEEIIKARRPGLKKIVDSHSLNMSLDVDKAELKDIRNELFSVLLGEAPVAEKKTRTSKVATAKVAPTVDFSKAPNAEALEAMDEAKLISVITDYNLPIEATLTKLKAGGLADDAFFTCVDEIVASLKTEEENQSKVEPVVEAKPATRARRGATTATAEPKTVKLVEIKVEDLPESEPADGTAPVEGVDYLAEMDEKGLIEVISKFGLNIEDKLNTALVGGKLADDTFFAVVDAIDAELEKIANLISDGKKPTYPAAVAEKKTARAKKSPASEAKLEAGNEVDDNYENIDLDNADVDFSDINIEDINTEQPQ